MKRKIIKPPPGTLEENGTFQFGVMFEMQARNGLCKLALESRYYRRSKIILSFYNEQTFLLGTRSYINKVLYVFAIPLVEEGIWGRVEICEKAEMDKDFSEAGRRILWVHRSSVNTDIHLSIGLQIEVYRSMKLK